MGIVILLGDCISRLSEIESNSIQCCVTSPPYWGLRDYGVEGQLGLENTPQEYVGAMRMVFEQVRRVLRPDGTLWLNLGDSYASANPSGKQGSTGERANRSFTAQTIKKMGNHLKPKDLAGIPWQVAFALQKDGWYLRQDIIWHKPNPMPESVTDRCTKAHEYIFLLSKSSKYYFDHVAIREQARCPEGNGNLSTGKYSDSKMFRRHGKYSDSKMFRRHGNLDKIGPRDTRNKRSVWTVTTKPFKGAHFATFPPDLIEPCILAGSRQGDTILDPFFGAGTVGLVAMKHQRNWVGIELNKDYCDIAEKRLTKD